MDHMDGINAAPVILEGHEMGSGIADHLAPNLVTETAQHDDSQPRISVASRNVPKIVSNGSSMPQPADATSAIHKDQREHRKDERLRSVVIYQDSAEKKKKPFVKPMTAEEKALKKKT